MVLKEADIGASMTDIRAGHGIADGTFYEWRPKKRGALPLRTFARF